jgi:hypothetical protein
MVHRFVPFTVFGCGIKIGRGLGSDLFRVEGIVPVSAPVLNSVRFDASDALVKRDPFPFMMARDVLSHVKRKELADAFPNTNRPASSLTQRRNAALPLTSSSMNCFRQK